MTRSNGGNGGSFFDLEFQLVSSSETEQVVRAVVYLTSMNVSDTTNNFEVWGDGYGRSGAIALGGTYNATPIWFQDTTHHRAIGANRTIGVGARISSVEYWGTTLEAVTYYTVPARYEAPSAPGTKVDSITATGARVQLSAPSYNGGASINGYQTHILSNNRNPGTSGAVSVASVSGSVLTTSSLLPGTTYYYTGRARNSANIWGPWAPMKSFQTLPAALVKSGGSYKNALVYVKHNGSWRLATPYVKHNGTWKIA